LLSALSAALPKFPNPLPPSQFGTHDEWEKREKERAQQTERDHRNNLLRAAKIPKRYVDGIPIQEGPWKKVLDHLIGGLGHGSLFIIIGNRGTGKTHMACEAIKHTTLNLGKPALFTSAIEVFLSIRDCYRGGEQGEREVMNQFAKPQLLVIDEAHERGDTAWEDRTLTHLIDRRYRDMHDTVLISNLSPEAVSESLGPSIIDRVRETGTMLMCNWQSFRQKGRAAGVGA
jgi:DNA replication protein DnaC